MEQTHIDQNKKFIQRLAAEYRQENLCLFIGSGVSKGCGLPDWKELTDDLLERLPDQLPKFGAIASPADPIRKRSIPVYHVHGLMPEDSTLQTRGDLVLSEEDYHRVYSDAYHWSNTVQLTLLRQHTSILIGLSVDDPNMRRILDIVQREGAYGVRYVMLRIPPRVFKGIFNTVYWTVTTLFERAMDALGLKVIWLREFDEIPIILRALLTENPAGEYIRHLPEDRIGYQQLEIEEEKGNRNDRDCKTQSQNR